MVVQEKGFTEKLQSKKPLKIILYIYNNNEHWKLSSRVFWPCCVPSEILKFFIWKKKIAQVVGSNYSLEGGNEFISAASRKINANGYIHIIGIIQMAFLRSKFMCLKTFSFWKQALLNLYLLTDLHVKFYTQSTEKNVCIFKANSQRPL